MLYSKSGNGVETKKLSKSRHLLSSCEQSLNVRTAHWLLKVLLVRPFVAHTGRMKWGQGVCPQVFGGLSQNTECMNSTEPCWGRRDEKINKTLMYAFDVLART